MSNPATDNLVKNTDKAPSISDSIRKFLEDKDWKFYTAVGVGAVAVGAGVYYLTRSGSPKPSTKKSRKGASKRGGAKESLSEKAAKTKDALEEKVAEAQATDPKTSSNTEEIESMPETEIAKLSKDKRNAHAATLKSKGNAKFGAKNYPEAIRLYTQAIAFSPDPVFYSNRAACFANLGDNEKVIEDCTSALRMDPVYVKALNRRAQAYEKKGDLREALYDFTAVCIIDGFKNDAAAAAMERLLKTLSEKRAKELLLEKKPRLPSPTFVSAYLDSFREDKTELPPLPTGSPKTGDDYYILARHQLRQKEYENAMNSYNAAVEKGCRDMAKALNMKATFTFLKGNAAEALEDFTKAISADPQYVQSYVKRASIYMEQGNPAETFAQFEKAIELDSKNPDIYYHRGQVNFITGDFESAARDYTKSIELDSSFVYAHIQLGVAQYKTGQLDTAMKTFQDALKKFSKSADVHNYYGELLLDQQKLSEAVEKFDKAIKLDKENPLPYINKALLVFQFQQNAKEAEDLCREALKVDPNCDVAIATLAQLLLQQGRTQDAIEYFEKSVDLARTEAELANAISYLEAASSQIRFAKDYPQFAEQLGNAARI